MSNQVADYRREVFMTYGDWESINNNRNAMYFKKLNQERIKRANYYKRQRAFGFALLIVAIITLTIACANGFGIMQGVGFVIALLGLYTTLTKQMVLIDSYYLECMDKINFG